MGTHEKDYTASIFYTKRKDIKSFDEFRFFTGVTRIPKYLFYECSRMEQVTLPDGITTIGQSSFVYCESLKELQVPASVTALDGYVFSYCHQLSTLKFLPLSAPTLGAKNTFNSLGGSATGKKILYVPAYATGYEEGYWKDPLCSSSGLGFTLSKTL